MLQLLKLPAYKYFVRYSIASQEKENTLLQHIGLFIQVLVYLVYLHSNINFSPYFPDC